LTGNPKPQPTAARGSRQRQRTRNAILVAGQQLFASRAMESVTIDEIVDAAEVAKGSFYNHFDDKEGLAKAVYEMVQGDCEFHIFAANRDVADPAARVVRALCVVLLYALQHPDRLQAMISLSERKTTANSPLNVGVAADIENGLRQERMRGLDVEGGVLVVLGLVLVAVRHAMSSDTRTPASMIATTMGAATLRALGLDHAEAERLAQAAADDILGSASVR
jgi:AcrR family transcriptional regulator